MPTSFDLLQERLLRGGVRPRHARRYLSELRDHLDDILAEERLTARGEQGAHARALARLGSVDALADSMIERPEFRAWSSKAPVVAYLIAPSLGLVVCAGIAVAVVVGTCLWLKGAGDAVLTPPPWLGPLAAGVVVFSNAMLPVLLGWVLAAMALRQRSSPFWPILGIVVLSALGAAVQVVLTLPSVAGPGEIDFTPSFASLAQWAGFARRLGLDLALTITPYAGLALWRSERAGVGKRMRDPARYGDPA